MAFDKLEKIVFCVYRKNVCTNVIPQMVRS